MKQRGLTYLQIMIVLAIVGLLAALIWQNFGTRGKPVAISPAWPTISSNNFDVQLLFRIDGLKVYRFRDAGKYIYVVDGRNSSTNWEETESAGKALVARPVRVETK